MTAVEFKGGRKPVDHAKPKLMLAPRLDYSEGLPATSDYLSRVPDWPMYQNDVCGDCTIATVGHALQAVSTYGTGSELRLDEEEVLNKYVALSGYNPQTGENDTGLIVQDVLNDWRKVGYYDPTGENHKALIFAWIDPSNLNAVRSAINIFGWVYLGVTIRQSAMDQFNARAPWSLMPNDHSDVLGGHAIPCGAYREDGSFGVITWGRAQILTEDWFRANVEECWVVVTPEWLSQAGVSPTGLDLYGLGEDYAHLTGNSNPFPAPPPPPEPEPEPEPVPVDPGPPPEPEPEPDPEPPLPEFRMPACAKHVFKGHRWWCKLCDCETESQFKETAEALWALQREQSNESPS